jgi:small-conductance mechanosensitive channel
LNERVIFRIHAGHGAQTAEERARAAEEALDTASAGVEPDEVRVEQQHDVAVIFAAKVPIVQLYERDATLAGDVSLDVHAAGIAAQIRETLKSEKKRSAIAGTVFSFSLVIFFGLLALYLIRKVGDLAARARRFIHDNPERIPALRVHSIEVVRPALLRGVVQAVLGLGKWLLQIGIAYGWLVFALSLFAPTRAYTERLTGFVVTPVTDLFARFAASLPVLLVAGVAAAAVYVLVRFVSLFFAGVSRGETPLTWLPADLAAPTSFLLRASIVIGALVFGAPVVTGDPEGALARSGSILLGALALASTPLLASGVTGVAFVFLRRVKVGDFAEYGGRSGRVLGVGLLDVTLRDAQGCEVRVPHLLSLVHPTTILGTAPRTSVEVAIPAQPLRKNLRESLLEQIAGIGEEPEVEVVSIEPQAVRFRVSVRSAEPHVNALLQARLLDVLSSERPQPPPARVTRAP